MAGPPPRGARQQKGPIDYSSASSTSGGEHRIIRGMGVPFVLPGAGVPPPANVFTTFPSSLARCDTPGLPLTVFLRTEYTESADPQPIIRSYAEALKWTVRSLRPKEVAVVFDEEEDHEDWWDEIAPCLGASAERLAVVNLYGASSPGAPTVPPLHRFPRLESLAVYESGWSDVCCGADMNDVLSPGQMARIKRLEFKNIDADVLNFMIDDGKFSRAEELVLHDADAAPAEILLRLLRKLPRLKRLVMSAEDDPDTFEETLAKLWAVSSGAPGLELLTVECGEAARTAIEASGGLPPRLAFSEPFRLGYAMPGYED